MFHEGDLQSGISTAIRSQRLVACFIHNDNATSQDWETVRLPQLQDIIPQKAVLLKIQQGSQEASFLSAFCPISEAPMIFVINNGRVVGQIGPTVAPEAWKQKLLRALGVNSGDTSTDPTGETSKDQPVDSSVSAQASIFKEPHSEGPASIVATQTAPSTTTQPVSTPAAVEPHSQAVTARASVTDRSGNSETIATPITDPAERLAQEKAQRVAAAEARRIQIEADQEARREQAHAEQRRKGKQPAKVESDLPPKARTDWIELQSKRKQEVKAERERILKQIAADREERKLRTSTPSSFSTLLSTPAEPKSSSGCALQVRLIDGSSIRKQFSAEQTIMDVRDWIKEAASEESITKAYTFRQLLIPQPSWAIDPADEHKSLQELGLTPSATLVLSSLEAMPQDTPSIFMRIISTIFGMFASLFAWLASDQRAPPISAADGETSASTTGRNSGNETATRRAKTLAESRVDTQDDRSTEFYNGNSSAFESRNDDGE